MRHCTSGPQWGRARLRAVLTVVGLAALVAGCQHNREPIVADTIPTDYRQRHPIAIQEMDRTVEVFVGSARGGLTSAQQADVAALAGIWRHEATGGIIIDVPEGSRNARAAIESLREIKGILNASGVPPRSIAIRKYRPHNPAHLATIRLNYPRIAADAGPCGQWPEDLGPSRNRIYLENKPYWNLGCATQRNFAAMVDNPADLVQPRPETVAYTSRRAQMFDKYRKGVTTATQYPEATQAKISDVGK